MLCVGISLIFMTNYLYFLSYVFQTCIKLNLRLSHMKHDLHCFISMLKVLDAVKSIIFLGYTE